MGRARRLGIDRRNLTDENVRFLASPAVLRQIRLAPDILVNNAGAEHGPGRRMALGSHAYWSPAA
jgi:hypothetical protein